MGVMELLLPLVERARDGDRAAFGDLHARFARPVYLALVGLLRRREDAEDAWQVTFLAAWRHLPRLRRADRFPGWLFRIARNAARDVAQRRKRFPAALPDASDLVARPNGLPAPPSAADPLPTLVGELRPETRALVLLRAVEGWSAEEVAAAFSWSASTVRRRYARALALLRARLVERNGT